MLIDIYTGPVCVNEGCMSHCYHGSAEADNLRDAAIKLAAKSDSFRKSFDLETMTWWGCPLYDNEAIVKQQTVDWFGPHYEHVLSKVAYKSPGEIRKYYESQGIDFPPKK